jgi:Protein related to penicillin acylase
MMALQTDNLNAFARLILPPLLDALRTASFSSLEQKCLDELRRWNFEYRPDLIAPTIFEAFASELSHALWDDDLPSTLPRPIRNVTAAQLTGTAKTSFIDNVHTPETETLSDLAYTAFRAAVDTLRSRYGDFGENWKWGTVRKTTIQHLARLDAFSRTLSTSGNYNTVNATSQRFGPSWRMVVQLGDTLQAWGIYPGGQSGNPGSFFYDHLIIDWAEGRYCPIKFLRSPSENVPGIIGKTTLLPGSPDGQFFSTIGRWLIEQWWLWWALALLLTSLLISRVKFGFIVGAFLVGAIWLGFSLHLVNGPSDLIASKIAELIKLSHPAFLVGATTLVGIVIGALGGATGSALRAFLSLKPSPAQPA